MKQSAQKSKAWGAALLVVLLAGAVGGVIWWATAGATDDPLAGQPTFIVEPGPLVISVDEAGTIQARDQVVIKSQVEGQTTIIYLIPEGTHVEAGDLLVELDASNLQDQLVNQQISVQNAEAAFIRARENLAVVKNQAASDIAQAELDYQFAQEDLTRYVEGEYPRQLKEAESKITLAREELERATEKLKWSERLFEEKYISQTELESDRLAMKRAELDYELAQADRELLVKYTHAREMTSLKAEVEQKRMALERVRRKASADIVQAEADLRAKQSEFDRQKDKLAKIEDQIAKCRITAPTSGMVIYSTTGKGNWRGNQEPLAEGQQVRERQELIYLPTAGAMTAEVKVHESALEKVRVAQPVRLTVDALPGRVYTGKVTRIAPLPDAQSVWLNPDLKVYSTEITLDPVPGGELRTGMSCQAQILVARYDEALFVPVQSVVRRGRTPMVYVVHGGQVEPRPIELGLDNNRMVRIESGLSAGERVLLAPPLEATVAELAPGDETLARDRDGARMARDGVATSSADEARPGASTGERAADDNAPGDAADATDVDAAALAQRLQSMTPEQRAALRERFESMTPEQRRALREQMRQQRAASDERPAPAAEAQP